MRRPLTPQDLAALFSVALIWGVNNVITKPVVEAVPPIFVAGLRFAVTFLCLAPLIRLSRRGPGPGWAPLLIVAACSGPIHFAILYAGYAKAEALAPLLIGLQAWVPFSVILAGVFLGERMGWRRGGGVALAFFGVGVIAFDPRVLRDLDALALVLVASFFWALASVLTRKFGGLAPLTMQAWTGLLAAVPLLVASSLVEANQFKALAQAGPLIWAAILFMGVASSIIANATLFRLVQRYEVSQITPAFLLTPIIGLSLSVAFLGDALSWRFAAGAAATLAGVFLALSPPLRAKAVNNG